MDIPLNIDWQQILLHLLNFVILAVGLYVLLYKPVKNFMDKRAEAYKKMDDEAKEKLENAEKARNEYNEKLANAQNEINAMKNNAAKETEQATQSQLDNAKLQAEKIIKDAKENANAEKNKIVAEAQTEIAELAAKTVEKISKSTLEDSFDEFLNDTRGE